MSISARSIGYTVIVLSWIPLAIIVLFLSWFYFHLVDIDENRGFHFGYYGVFNRTHDALEEMPGVEVLDSFENRDVTLEEFAFAVEVQGRTIEIFFEEDDPTRKLKGDALKTALRQAIKDELSSEVHRAIIFTELVSEENQATATY